MTFIDDISKSDCKKISYKIRNDIFQPVNNYKTTIFLCGADIKRKDKLRYKIDEALNGWRYSFQFDIIYPESIFEELLYSSQKKDLLSLENLLAESVDAVVIIPESPGSFTELGAFANDDKLRNKITCVMDMKYKKDRSFINQGPIKLIKKTNKLGVIFIDPLNLEKGIEKLNFVLRKLKKNSTKLTDKISLLQIENFLLPAIYLLEPVSKETLKYMVGYATEDEENSFQSTIAALTIMIKNRQIELTANHYKLTKSGINDFFNFRKIGSRLKTQERTNVLDDLRLEILNLKNRNKKLKV